MNELHPISHQPNDMWVLPWDPCGLEDEERVASTLNIREQLKLVKPNTFDEYPLCFEAALDDERTLSDREKYLLSRYGQEYALAPTSFNQKLDDLEARIAINVGEFVLIQKSPTWVFVDRLSSPNLTFFSKIGGQGFPYMGMAVETSSSIMTIVDDQFNIIPELTRDFVEIKKGFRSIAEGSTRLNWDYRGLLIDAPSYHEGDEYTVRFGMEEIMVWQRNNFRWAEHIDNMMGAWNTKLINYPAAEIKLKSPLGESSLRRI